MNTTLELDGNVYLIGTLDAMRQFHVARRVAPILAELGFSVNSLTAAADDDMLSLLGPVTKIIAAMSDADVEYVIRTCLLVVKRQVGDKWAQVQTAQGMMFQDITMPSMLRLTVEVVKENMAGFFVALPNAGSST